MTSTNRNPHRTYYAPGVPRTLPPIIGGAGVLAQRVRENLAAQARGTRYRARLRRAEVAR